MILMPRSVESEGGEQHADEGTARSPEETDRDKLTVPQREIDIKLNA